MRALLRLVSAVCLGLYATLATAVPGLSAAVPMEAHAASSDVTTRIVAAAQALLASLDEAGRSKVQFPFDGPQKAQMVEPSERHLQRDGLRLGDLTPAQRTAAMALLSAALSRDGYQKVVDIMRGDEALRRTTRARTGRTAAGGAPRDGPGPGRPAGPVVGPASSSAKTSTTSRSLERRQRRRRG